MRNIARRLDSDQFDPWLNQHVNFSNLKTFHPPKQVSADEYLRWVENADALAARASNKKNQNEA